MGRRSVLFVNPFRAPASGPDESLLALIGHLDPEQHRAIVALPPGSPHARRYGDLGAEVVEVPIWRLRRSLAPGYLLGTPWAMLRDLRGFRRVIRQRGIELVHCNMESAFVAAVAAHRLGVPVVQHVRSTSIARPAWMCSALVGVLHRNADRVVCITEAVAQLFTSRDRSQRVVVIPNGIEAARFADPAAGARWRAACGIAAEQPLVGTLGRINPRKDLATFLDAAAQVRTEVPEAGVVLAGRVDDAGERAYLEELRRRADRLGLGRALRLVLDPDDVPGLLGALDVFLMCSVDEGFGRVCVEAMASGTPVVASAVGGLREIVTGGAGVVVPPREARAFAAAAVVRLRDRGLAASEGEAGRRRVARLYDAAAVAARIRQLYGELLGPGETDARD